MTASYPAANIKSRNMVLGQLLTNDIINPNILQAMEQTQRELFVPQHLRGAAYVDEDLEVAPGRYLIKPLMFAMLLDIAKIAPTDRVLIIGCLSGYAAAVAGKLAQHVVATDSDEQAIAQAREHMKRLGLSNVQAQKAASLGDGFAPGAPYNAIIICGAVSIIPDALRTQLAEGGRMALVRNVSSRADLQGGLGKGVLVEKINGQLQLREHFDASTALLPGFERASGFIF